MLEFFRRYLGGGLMGFIIVGVLAAAFAFSFGAQSKGWGKAQSESFAATVDGEELPEGTFKYAFNLLGGRNLEKNDSQWLKVQRTVLEGLIERQLLLGLAEEAGISASVNEAEERIATNIFYLTRPVGELADYLASNMFIDPAITARVLVTDGHRVRQSFLDQEGKFDLESYQKFIRYYLQTTDEIFVEQQRLEIIAERMRQAIVTPIRVSDEEVRVAYNRENDTATIEYIRLIPSFFADALDPTAAELAAWTKTHRDEIKQYYETNKFRYTNLEKMAKASHILIKVPEDATEEDIAGARLEIEGLLAKVKAGENFAALAKVHSQDPGSAVKGGDLGFTPRGRMVPEFEEAMFNAEPGVVTDIVKTKYGFHIIKVDGFREGNITLEDATSEIADQLYKEIRSKEEAGRTGEAFLARLKAGETMESLVPEKDEEKPSALNLSVRTSRPFSSSAKSIPGIGEAPELVKAVFETSESEADAPGLYEIRGDTFVVKLKERTKPSDEEFAKLKPKLAQKLLSIKQGAWLRDTVTEIKERADKEKRILRYYNPLAMNLPRREPGEPVTEPAAEPEKSKTPAAETSEDKPTPAEPEPTPTEPEPAPAKPEPTPVKAAPAPAKAAPVPAKPAPRPAKAAPAPVEAAPVPAKPAPAPVIPAPAPVKAAPVPAKPAPAPVIPAPAPVKAAPAPAAEEPADDKDE